MLLNRIKKKKKSIDELIKEAEIAARAGRPEQFYEAVRILREYASVEKLEISPDQEKEILSNERKVKVKDLELCLMEASEAARRGDKVQFDYYVKKAQDFAKLEGTPFTKLQKARIAKYALKLKLAA